MNKSSLFQKLNQEYKISDIEWQTQKSKKESILFYRMSDNTNSESLLLERLKNAQYACLVTNREVKFPLEKHYVVGDSEFLNLQKEFLDKLYPYDKEQKFIAVTGTNGKTSCVDFLTQLLGLKKYSTLSIGTLGIKHNGIEKDNFGLTTPSYIDFRKYLNNYPADYVLFEASSHAIEQERFFKVQLDAVIWTSFSQDHLDYHKTMENYYNSKYKIKDSLKDGRKIHIHHTDEKMHKEKESFEIVEGELQVEQLFLQAEFNKKNLSLVLKVLDKFNIQVSKDELVKLKPVDGRFNVFENETKTIIIDYAHTPDALVNICRSIKSSFKGTLLTIFGCGGDRDRTKRPLMGQAACENSDYVFVSSDNPRTEDPNTILDDIKTGIEQFKNYEIIKDRAKAIEKSFNTKYDLILIAGKGHEPYMDINGKKYPYSDEEEVKKHLK